MRKKEPLNALIVVIMLVIVSMLAAMPAGFEEELGETDEYVSVKTTPESSPISPSKDQGQEGSVNTDVLSDPRQNPDTDYRDVPGSPEATLELLRDHRSLFTGQIRELGNRALPLLY